MFRSRASFMERALSAVLRDHEPVFTHGDLQRKNFMVTDPELVIVDWETAGWYPSYWEYVMAMSACGNMKDDWNVWVDRVMQPYYSEFAWINTLMTEMLC